jgi:hypothetical protein
MARTKKLTKEERVQREEERLLKFLTDVDPKKKNVVEGLVQRCAHLRVTLDDLAEDLDENGYTEMFQQGEKNPPYERKRPSADLYTTMNTLYQKSIKQLTDLLPKDAVVNSKQNDDGFDDFVNSLDD